MNCTWRDIPDSTDARGWRRVECIRCGLQLHPTPHEHGKIYAECLAWPRWHELGHWTALWLEVFGLSKKRWAWLVGAKGCGCGQREAALNHAGSRLAAWFNRP